MSVYFIHSVLGEQKTLLPGTYKTKEAAEEEIERLNQTGMVVDGVDFEVEEFQGNE